MFLRLDSKGLVFIRFKKSISTEKSSLCKIRLIQGKLFCLGLMESEEGPVISCGNAKG